MKKDQRRLSRHPLIYCLNVLKYDSKELLGHIINISLKGALMVSKNQVPIGTQIKLHIVLPPTPKYPGETYLDIEADSVRSCQNSNIGYYDTGFHFLVVSSAQQEIINYLIDEYKF